MKKYTILFLISLFSVFSIGAQFHDVPVARTGLNVGISIISENDTTRIEPIKYSAQKVGSGAFLSGLTYGLAKVKNKIVYKGKNSPNKAKVGDTIRFAFGNVPPQYLAEYYMFQPVYTIRNFSLCKFDVKKKQRELKSGEISLWEGSDFGVKENNDVEFDVDVKDGQVFDAKIVKAKPGEYCFVFSDRGVGIYMSVFDFAIE